MPLLEKWFQESKKTDAEFPGKNLQEFINIDELVRVQCQITLKLLGDLVMHSWKSPSFLPSIFSEHILRALNARYKQSMVASADVLSSAVMVS